VSTAHYEALRAWAVARPRPNQSPAGAALLLRQGVVAWLLAWPTWSSAPHHAPLALRSKPEAAMAVTAEERALVGVLASMVEHCQQEESS
jgi:hypothetical protein